MGAIAPFVKILLNHLLNYSKAQKPQVLKVAAKVGN
jgi:hypothetical protein